jgi:hypothetical protein
MLESRSSRGIFENAIVNGDGNLKPSAERGAGAFRSVRPLNLRDASLRDAHQDEAEKDSVLGPRWGLCSGQPKAGPEYGDEREGRCALRERFRHRLSAGDRIGRALEVARA